MRGRNKRKRKEGHHDMDWTRDRNEHGCIQETLLVFYVEQDFILFQIFPQVLHTKVLWNFKAPIMWYSRTSSYSSQFSMSNWPHFLSYLIPSKHSGQWESSMAISMTVCNYDHNPQVRYWPDNSRFFWPNFSLLTTPMSLALSLAASFP